MYGLQLLLATTALSTENPDLYCRTGRLGGAAIAEANVTMWAAARRCANHSAFDGKICIGKEEEEERVHAFACVY